MNKRYLLSAAVLAALSTTALAQSPSTSTSTSTPSTPSASGSPTPSAGASSNSSATTSTPAAGTSASQSGSGTTPSAASSATTSPNASTATSTTPNATGTAQSPNSAANSGAASSTTQPAAANQSQPAAGSSNAANAPANSATGTNNAAAPSGNQPATAQSAGSSTNVSVNLNDQQRTRVSESFARVDVKPLTNVNFSVSVGTVVPRDVRLEAIPSDVVAIVPQYRGYSYFAVRDEIVIVEPSTLKIVTVLPRSGSSTARAPVQSDRKVATETRSKPKFSESDREVVRKHVRTRERRTVGSASTMSSVRIGERVPDTVEIHTFTDDDTRLAPSLREYRYIEHQNRAYIVDPGERRIIEEID